MPSNQRDETRQHEYTVTNFSGGRSLSSLETTTVELSYVLTALINDLIESGTISGGVT